METYQLKKITIIVLLLVNLALLALLGQSALQQRSAEQQALMQLKDLYLSSGMELALDALPHAEKQSAATVQHSLDEEIAFAEAFLGKADLQESGSSMLYSSQLGAMRLRRNSAFELNMYTLTLTKEHCLSLMESLGYTAFPYHESSNTIYLTQTIDAVPLVDTMATLHFSGDFLTSASGFYITGVQEGDALSPYTAADALSAFLQYALEQEITSLRVQSISPTLRLSAETLFQSNLLPAWVIQTEKNSYYVSYGGDEIAPLPEGIS